MRSAGSLIVQRDEEPRRREVVAAERRAVAAEVDRHHHAQVLGRVRRGTRGSARSPPTTRGDERVVQRSADRLGGALEVVERHLERRRACGRGVRAPHDRRARDGGRCEERTIDRRRARRLRSTPRGSRAMARAAPTALDTPRCAIPSARRRRWSSERPTSPSGVNTGSSLERRRRGPGAAGSRSRSNSIMSSFMPPTPSVIEWWTLMIIADPPPTSPSTTVYSHSGRARSKPAIAALRATSSTASKSPGSGARIRRRWYDRSKFGSADQCGGPTRSSGVTTRWRMRGISRVPRSIALHERGPVGAAVEREHGHDGRAERRILLDVPHERVGVAHVEIELLGPGHGPRVPLHHGPRALASLPALCLSTTIWL